MNRYKNEANRLYGVLDRQLKDSKYVACSEYTIADMATMPWLRFPERQGVNIDEYPHLKKWRDGLLARPAGRACATGARRSAASRDDKGAKGKPVRRNAICPALT
jgi:GST-like protein